MQQMQNSARLLQLSRAGTPLKEPELEVQAAKLKTESERNMRLFVVILTFNESRHIERAIESVTLFAERVLVVDSGSTDDTVPLAEALGATVYKKPWVNYATQFNWALNQLPDGVDWVLRLDADEVVTPHLVNEILTQLPNVAANVNGIYLPRRMNFLGQPMRWGGVFPVHVLRIFRPTRGRVENRWMDEHLIVEGETCSFDGGILDDNLNSLSWWTNKHNAYASREVVDVLNLQYNFFPQETIAKLQGGEQASVKRWLKENVYAHLPGGLRAFTYFVYRYLLRLGFLDGKPGMIFHVLQGFWYRYLVDAKLYEVKAHMRRTGASPVDAIEAVLGLRVK